MNVHELQRAGLLGQESTGGLGVERGMLQGGLPFSVSAQSHLTGMSLVSQVSSNPPPAGSHAAALQRLHLQRTAGLQPGQCLLGSFPGSNPAMSLGSPYKGSMKTGRAHTQDYYYRKWKRLKKYIKDTVFINASVCDEVIRVEEKLARCKEERRFLLRKLVQYQSLTEATPPLIKQEVTTPQVKVVKTPNSASSTLSEVALSDPGTPISAKAKSAKKKVPSTVTDSKKKVSAPKDTAECVPSKPKKSKSSGANRRTSIPPIPLDPTGRPVFPLVLGELTVHSLGELNPERSCFHCPESIYPVGFCSTRVYADVTNPEVRCMYTCKISDSGASPVFEIALDDSPDKIWRGKSPGECHNLLMRALIKTKNVEVSAKSTSGLDFFGLTHPLVQNLIQSLPGARKCSGYKWHKFEVNKGESIENIVHCRDDPVTNFDALRKVLGPVGAPRMQTVTASAHLEPSTSLRSLLTSGPFSTSTFPQK